MKKNENAFTGLEAAIVLIAFVVVAAVFSYVMLGAGFFTAQKSQEVVHTGIGQAASSIEVVGDVIGEGVPAHLNTTRFAIHLTSGMNEMNISAMRVTYSDPGTRQDLTFDSTNSVATGGAPTEGPADPNTWIIRRVENRDFAVIPGNDRVLRPGEKFLLEMAVPTTSTPNTRFVISMQPEVGALTTVVRTVPASIYPVNILR
ncbi:hypothetical protein RJ53_02375 [Methanocalculus chunghsingensis]|uniref:Flagellin n=1 Tax=Methanocalculus chunghsingensis TaxID=156457 RepID=A0A8J7W657_9EURY|nr:archaellin/type IV pilin N-terminal domain-containing protein [Methanocalculus chunghsingensis]MBR1368406.1 hypothetical protein [Methanocalculus chunghsingensis]